jgi:hypothetical protein
LAVTPESQCRKCGVALHSCVNCRHFDTSARFECRLDRTDRIASKTKANHCEGFDPKRVQEVGGGERSNISSARDAFDALFKI